MRLRPSNNAILLFVCFTLVSAISVKAQEDRSQAEIEAATRETFRNEPDPILTSESESRIPSKITSMPSSTREIPRDSAVQVKTIKPVKSAEKVEKEEDPLSFNFLYYIIEKFKMSDIIE
jgi:hypothetical protein